MNILSRSHRLVSVLKSHTLLEKTGLYRSVCSASRARCESLCLSANISLCPHWHHTSSHNVNTNRYYSEMCNESSDLRTNIGGFQQESHEMDGDSGALRPKSIETFNLDALVSLLRQENAVDICVIKVPEQIKYTQFFVVVSGVSTRHLRAMALYVIKVYKFMKKHGTPDVKIEGKDSEDWMCIDFGNMVVHFMLPETREVYELEKLWTLRSYDEQLKRMPAEMLPEDFIYDAEVKK